MLTISVCVEKLINTISMNFDWFDKAKFLRVFTSVFISLYIDLQKKRHEKTVIFNHVNNRILIIMLHMFECLNTSHSLLSLRLGGEETLK